MSNEDICHNVTFSLLDFINKGDWVDRYMNAKGVADRELISGALIFVTELFTYGKSTTQASCIERAEKIEAAIKAIEADFGFSQTIICDSREIISGGNLLARKEQAELTLNYHAEMLFSLSWLAKAYRGRAKFVSLIPRKDTTIYYLIGLVFSSSDTELSIPLPTITQAIELAAFIASESRKFGISVGEPAADSPSASRQMRAGAAAGVALSRLKSEATSNCRLPGIIMHN